MLLRVHVQRVKTNPMNPRFHPLLYGPNTCDFHRSCCHRILHFGGRVAFPWCCIRPAILLCIKNPLEVSLEIPLDVRFWVVGPSRTIEPRNGYSSCHLLPLRRRKHPQERQGSNRKQKYLCHDCAKQSREDPGSNAYPPQRREEILSAYQKRSSLRGLARTFGLSPNTLTRWLKKALRLPPLSQTL